MPKIQLTAHYVVASERRDEAIGLIAEIARLSRLEPGNLSYDAYQSFDDPTRIALIEIYENDEAVQAHRESRHFQELVLAQLVPILTSRTVHQSVLLTS